MKQWFYSIGLMATLVLTSVLYIQCSANINRSSNGGIAAPTDLGNGSGYTSGGTVSSGTHSNNRDTSSGNGNQNQLPGHCERYPDSCSREDSIDLNSRGDGRNNREPVISVEERQEAYRDLQGDYSGYGDLTFDSSTNLRDFMWGVADYTNIDKGRVYADFNIVSGQKYYEGEVRVVYEYRSRADGTFAVDARRVFRSGSGEDAKHNVWARFDDNKIGFHGFFEGVHNQGAIIFVIDQQGRELTDENSNYLNVNGEIWYLSFKTTKDTKSTCHQGGGYKLKNKNSKCWNISAPSSPFNCQAWRLRRAGTSWMGDVQTLRELYPNTGRACYKKLATITDFPVDATFKDIQYIRR